MSAVQNELREFTERDYQYGFVTELETDEVPRGLNEDVVRLISSKKNEPEWLLAWRLKAYRHWLTMAEPSWANGFCRNSAMSPSMAARPTPIRKPTSRTGSLQTRLGL